MPTNWRIYSVMAVIIIGAIFQSFQNWKIKQANSGVAQEDLRDLDLRPFRMSDAMAKSRANFKTKKLTARQLKKSDVLFARNTQFDKDKVKDKDAKKKKTAKKKQKKDDKQQKTVEIYGHTNKVDIDQNENNNEPPTDNGNNNEDFLGGVGPGASPGNESDNEIPQTFDEWAAILLTQPDWKKLTQFIGYFQTNLVSAEVFYQIIYAMLDDSRESMNENGLRAAGSTPGFESFLVLASVLEHPSYTKKIKNIARSQLDTYKNWQHLGTLQSVLTGSTSLFTKTLAAEYLSKSAENNLAQTAAPDTNGGAQPQSQSSREIYKNKYLEIVALLRRLLDQSEFNNGFAQAATQTIDVIVRLTS